MRNERISSDKTTEDYLEAMLILHETKGYIRSMDVAAQLQVTKPSVTYTTKRLKERGLITMDNDNFIILTDEGIRIAKKIYHRHKALTDFFVMLGVDKEIAMEDACKIEHDISEETFNAICRHVEFYTSKKLAEK